MIPISQQWIRYFILSREAEDAFLKSAKELDDETIFGLCCSTTLDGCEDKMEEVYDDDDRYSDDDR